MRLLSCQEKTISQAYDIEALKAKIRQCDVCAHAVKPLPVVPNPILQGNAQSKIRIIGQAPGTLAHASGRPFTDPSGVRLRDWLGVSENVDGNAAYASGWNVCREKLSWQRRQKKPH